MKKICKVLAVSCLCTSFFGILTTYATAEKSANDISVVTAQKSDFENIAVSQVTGYVNIREQATTASNILGKIYNHCAATIVETVEGEGGTWYKIKSGSVEGYIKAQYFITGQEAEQLAQSIGREYATINTESLRLREQPDLTSNTLTLLSQGARYVVLAESGDFYKVAIDTDLEGFIAKSYCMTTIEFDQAVSLAEEQQKLAVEAQRRKDADTAMETLAQVIQVEAGSGSGSGIPIDTSQLIIEANPEQSNNDHKVSAPPSATAAAGSQDSSGANSVGPGSIAVVSATRAAIVAYSKQFLGNPYVFGGTSLTNGADCSGFTQGIFANFGISIGRSSRDQAGKGREIAVSDIQPGDLLFYASGDYINHVALYIGNGEVIHASNSTTGIIISPYNYRSPCKAVTLLE